MWGGMFITTSSTHRFDFCGPNHYVYITLLQWVPDANRATWKLDSLDFAACWLKFGAVTHNKWQTSSKDFQWKKHVISAANLSL